MRPLLVLSLFALGAAACATAASTDNAKALNRGRGAAAPVAQGPVAEAPEQGSGQSSAESPRAPADAPPQVELWRADIGLTNYRSTIHVHRGLVLVNSNGLDRAQLKDPLDGVHIFEANTGRRRLHIVPAGQGDKDTNGLAISGDTVVFGTDQGLVHAYSLSGAPRWSRRLGGGDVEVLPALADFNADGVVDVAIGEEGGDFYVLNGRDGVPIYTVKTGVGSYGQEGYNATVALFDVTGDGTDDIFLPGRDNTLRALDGRTGKILWEIVRTSGLHGSPIVVDTDGDGTRELIASEAYSEVLVVEPRSGALRWVQTLTHPTGGVEGLFSPLTWLPERRCVMTGTAWWGRREGFYCVGAKGPVWRHTEAAGNISSGAVLGDVTGDGQTNVVFGTESGAIVALDLDGGLAWRLEVGAPVECTPTLADVNGDGTLELLVAVNDGTLRVYGTAGRGPAALGYHRGGAANTGVLY